MGFTTLLFFIFIVIVGIQVIYYLTFLFTFSIKGTEVRKKKHIPISVIICAKNEAENLKQNLPYILNQKWH